MKNEPLGNSILRLSLSIPKYVKCAQSATKFQDAKYPLDARVSHCLGFLELLLAAVDGHPEHLVFFRQSINIPNVEDCVAPRFHRVLRSKIANDGPGLPLLRAEGLWRWWDRALWPEGLWW